MLAFLLATIPKPRDMRSAWLLSYAFAETVTFILKFVIEVLIFIITIFIFGHMLFSDKQWAILFWRAPEARWNRGKPESLANWRTSRACASRNVSRCLHATLNEVACCHFHSEPHETEYVLTVITIICRNGTSKLERGLKRVNIVDHVINETRIASKH